ncbi:hypothetical protein HDV01_007209 [Terramyces sp. JEL0728]|nr:hypothetical protein HDV01_007209 [Terramyces sp. JEL0728]
MPRYEPLSATESQPNPPPELPSGAPRYQQLHIDQQQARTQTARSPFYCTGCPTLIFPFYDTAVAYLPSRKQITGYISGFLFALGWWLFIDGAVFNAYKYDPAQNMATLSFEDWLPGFLSTLALIIVNVIDREMLMADDSAFEGNHVAMKARGCAFSGITMALGSVGGALAILSLKYIIPGLKGDAIYLGYCIAVQNVLIFASSMTLWFGRNSTEEGNIAI